MRSGAIVHGNYLGDTFESDMLMEDNIRRLLYCCAAERIYSPKKFLTKPSFCIIDMPSETRTRTSDLPKSLKIADS
ncbi:unnamed protein product, partial [Didymodactylos carnosus]